MIIRSGAILLAFGLVLFSSLAVTESAATEPALGQYQGIIKGETKEGFPYMSGGFGVEEREQMDKWGGEYNLKLSFAEKSGAYLADVKVVIVDEKGNEVLNTAVRGPWFYIKLPAGKYDVKATLGRDSEGIDGLQVSAGKQINGILSWDLS